MSKITHTSFMSDMSTGLSSEALALCPLDGRYSGIGERLGLYFSEAALVWYRVFIESQWLIFLIEYIYHPTLDKFQDNLGSIESICQNFSAEDFNRVKEIEAVTNHDVKSVELFVGEKLKSMEMEELISFVHIGCTSEDITNLAYALMIENALHDVWVPAAKSLLDELSNQITFYAKDSMLAHTHGQPATPTTVGKELSVFGHRMVRVLKQLEQVEICGKFNGATGNYAAISVAFPNEDWVTLSRTFVEDYLYLDFNPVTTQIESHDYICEIADIIRHFNNILKNLDVDMWLYISMDYFKQIPVKTEVGSSTMPHKVNPINFENSEANATLSNDLFVGISNKLSSTRMQRDLSDSSYLRNLGMAFGYSLQAIEATIKGLQKATINEEKIHSDLDEKWEVLAEPIQTMLRKYGIADAYNQLKKLTRGRNVTKEDIQDFIYSLDVLSEEDKNILLSLTPVSYTGFAKDIAFQTLDEINQFLA